MQPETCLSTTFVYNSGKRYLKMSAITFSSLSKVSGAQCNAAAVASLSVSTAPPAQTAPTRQRAQRPRHTT